MNEEKTFVDGMIFKEPHPNAPDFVKGSLSVKCRDFLEFMKAHSKDGWLNIDLKVSKGGKPYAELSTWEPNQQQGPQYNDDGTPKGKDFDDEIPFM